MEGGWQPEATLRARANQFKREYFDYVEKNIESIDANVPVFFGHVAAALDNSLPNLTEGAHDQFVDAITVKVLEVSPRAKDTSYIEKLFDYAKRIKKSRKGSWIYDIILGFRMLNNRQFAEAAERLRNYRSVDAVILPAVAYCYYSISAQQAQPGQNAKAALPNDMMLAAREHMMELVRINPPINRLRDHEMIEDETVNKIFWTMLNLSVEWFPKERGFFRIGIAKARKDANLEIRERLLTLAIERYSDEMAFLRELYHLKLDKRDAGGVAGVIKQMTQQYPHAIEPVYYGLKLSIITGRSETYTTFRKMALVRHLPAHILPLLDFGFELMGGKEAEALACLEDIRQKMGSKHFYVIMLEFAISDVFSEDETRSKKARKAVFDSLDQYCMKQLKIPAE
jgi:hypothetical protein